MPKGSTFEDLARQAAENMRAARAAGQQLVLLPDEAPAAVADGRRAPRGKGRAVSQLRDMLAARGMRMPEDVLTEIAGMASTEDAFLTAMGRTEQVLAWAEAGARKTVTGVREGALVTVDLDTSATMSQRVAMFQTVLATQLRAAEALLPYGLGKVTPDEAAVAPVQVFVAPGSAVHQVQGGADRAKDVTPRPQRLAPPPLPHEIVQNQKVAQGVSAAPPSDIRTEGASR